MQQHHEHHSRSSCPPSKESSRAAVHGVTSPAAADKYAHVDSGLLTVGHLQATPSSLSPFGTPEVQQQHQAAGQQPPASAAQDSPSSSAAEEAEEGAGHEQPHLVPLPSGKRYGLAHSMFRSAKTGWSKLRNVVKTIRRARSLAKADMEEFTVESQEALYLAQMGLSGVELQAGSRKDLMSINYTKQGNVEMYTERMLKLRHSIRADERVIAAVKDWWNFVPKGLPPHEQEEGQPPMCTLCKSCYCAMVVLIQMVILPKYGMQADIEYDPEEDWLDDNKGLTDMAWPNFFDALFELADMWCDNVDAQVYADLLKQTLQDAIASGLWEMLLEKFGFFKKEEPGGGQEEPGGGQEEPEEKLDCSEAAAPTDGCGTAKGKGSSLCRPALSKFMDADQLEHGKRFEHEPRPTLKAVGGFKQLNGLRAAQLAMLTETWFRNYMRYAPHCSVPNTASTARQRQGATQHCEALGDVADGGTSGGGDVSSSSTGALQGYYDSADAEVQLEGPVRQPRDQAWMLRASAPAGIGQLVAGQRPISGGSGSGGKPSGDGIADAQSLTMPTLLHARTSPAPSLPRAKSASPDVLGIARLHTPASSPSKPTAGPLNTGPRPFTAGFSKGCAPGRLCSAQRFAVELRYAQSRPGTAPGGAGSSASPLGRPGTSQRRGSGGYLQLSASREPTLMASMPRPGHLPRGSSQQLQFQLPNRGAAQSSFYAGPLPRNTCDTRRSLRESGLGEAQSDAKTKQWHQAAAQQYRACGSFFVGAQQELNRRNMGVFGRTSAAGARPLLSESFFIQKSLAVHQAAAAAAATAAAAAAAAAQSNAAGPAVQDSTPPYQQTTFITQ